MSGEGYLLAGIAVMALATLATRAAPFLFLRGRAAQHPLLLYLGRNLPPAVMLLLVLYSLRSLPTLPWSDTAAHLLAVGATVAAHLWRRNSLLSIGVGTALFMWLQQSGVLA